MNINTPYQRRSEWLGELINITDIIRRITECKDIETVYGTRSVIIKVLGAMGTWN